MAWHRVTRLDESCVNPRMLSNHDRLHTYVPAGAPVVLASLEMCVRAGIGSVFKGSA